MLSHFFFFFTFYQNWRLIDSQYAIKTKYRSAVFPTHTCWCGSRKNSVRNNSTKSLARRFWILKIVTSQMVHGPCGLAFPKLSCMYKGLCKKKYPRPFCSETNVDRHGYPQYRRRSPAEGGHVKKMGEDGGRGPRYLLDNRNIVPYSPTLCRLFDAHINVENVQSVKVHTPFF